MCRFTSIKMVAASFVFVLCLLFSSLTYAETFMVTNLNSFGEGSLREAILMANANDNPGVIDEIVFQDGLTGTIFMNGAMTMEGVSTNAFELGQMLISQDVSIMGLGKDVLTIDADNQSRIFVIDEKSVEAEATAEEEDERIKVSISGLRLINGIGEMGGGGAILNFEELSVDSCEFYNNNADGDGGAILSDTSGRIKEIKDSYFIMNSASDSGGAIAAIAESDIIKKAAEVLPIDEPEIGKIAGSTFEMNMAEGSGGAIILAREARAGEINGTTFMNNSAQRFGGGIYVQNLRGILSFGAEVGADLVEEEYNIKYLTDCEFLGNTAGVGGALHNDEGSIFNISDCSFTENIATGQSMRLDVSTNVEDPEPNNSALGGAIMNFAGLINMVERTTFSANQSYGFGGAVANIALLQSSGPGEELNEGKALPEIELDRSIIAMLKDSTFDENEALISGGAMANGSSTVEMLNTTYSENKAQQAGGALYSADIVGLNEESSVGLSSQLSIENVDTNELEVLSAPIAFISFSTFARNEAQVGGGVHEEDFEQNPESTHLRHTILALNLGGNCGGLQVEDEDGNHSDDESCGLDAGNSAVMTLGELADNGGPTQTIALLEGDPVDSAVECTAITMFGDEEVETEAIDPILLVEADQRGAPRAFGDNCDAGAFEFGAIAPGGFFHNPILPALASNINVINAEEASPEAPVAFLWGLLPGSTIIGGKVCNGIEIGINNPRLLAIEESSAEGIAEHLFFIPLIGDLELVILTQAVDINTCATSEVILDIIIKE